MAVLLKDMSLDEFLKLPEEKPALEFEDGRIIQKVSPQRQHGRLQLALGGLFDRYAIPRKFGMTFSELRVTSGRRSYVPDLSVVRWSRLAVDAHGEITNDDTEHPDVTVEIVSPGQSTTVLVRHCLWYVSLGIAVALLIDPADRSILSFRPNQIPVSLTGSDRIDLDDVLPGFELTVQGVFDLLKVD